MDLFDDTSSEKYRHECELRFIASMKLSERRKYLGLVYEKRGSIAVELLKEGLEKIWSLKNK